jgi:hypothetical protein
MIHHAIWGRMNADCLRRRGCLWEFCSTALWVGFYGFPAHIVRRETLLCLASCYCCSQQLLLEPSISETTGQKFGNRSPKHVLLSGNVFIRAWRLYSRNYRDPRREWLAKIGWPLASKAVTDSVIDGTISPCVSPKVDMLFMF